jgi:citrate synthase
VSRIAGWTAHVREQQSDNRLIRPLSNYTGQHHIPVDADRAARVDGITLSP